MPINDPVTNPLGALQEMAVGPAQSLLRQQEDSWNERQAQVGALKQLAMPNEEADSTARWAAMAQAAALHPPVVGGFGQLLASIGGAYGRTLAAQEQQNFNKQLAITRLMDDGYKGASTAAALMRSAGLGRGGASGTGKFVPVPGTPGLMVNNVTREQLDLRDAASQNQVLNIFGKLRGDYSTDEEALQAAYAVFGGTRGQLHAPTIAAAGKPNVVLEPGTDIAALIKQLERDEAEAVALGDYTHAREVQEAKRAISDHAKLLGVGAPIRKDKAAFEGAKETAKAGAKIYAESFEENVVKPAFAFGNTAKIMQDFNALGQMQTALKNGKLKEFMGGETGKVLLSFLPSDSDLAKGIANAQEAEKLTAGMVNQILLAAKGVQTEGDAQRARSQVTSIGIDPDANKYIEAYLGETSRQLKLREKFGRAHKSQHGTYEGYDDAWSASPLMTEARSSVKKLGNTWVGVTQYIDKFKVKNQSATDSDAIRAWNAIGAK
jgi:hypothetical protein